MNKSVIDQFLKPKNCEHYAEHVVDVDQIRVSRLFPENGSPSNSEILIAGLHLKECLRCGAILTDFDKHRIKTISRMLSELQSLYQGREITLRLKESKAEPVSTNLTVLGSPELTEKVSFQAVYPRFGLDDVILNRATQKKLEEVSIRLKYGDLFFVRYNFQKVRPYGRATVVLFYGASGTGKTRTAEGLAQSLGLKFLDVNLSDLTSRFMSQTSKNIQQAFDQASDQNALIFFDEADTVLGKRLSDISQGVEAEINMARSTMLKELERFNGVCVFATNFVGAIDKAFTRRISYIVPFELPDAEHRKSLWDYFLLETLPLENPKNEWIDELVELSEGMTGADIVLAIELTFPMAIVEDENQPVIRKNFLLQSLFEMKRGKKIIGTSKELEQIKDTFNLK
ncbi:ATP-binding protein [Dyadobacter chenwenxiniae]|uniref:ATP-binding protein n=1 Tax=Dyadobacter chenwenxiniae TaxID=2906456 RepID=A0A9X1TCZ5_9BACT|nr:ATP-binding protein [Dyadobacter chenwenxiniae]MCF0061361.1 ATP-binding protein [Dyadobacter chenwenxiniae]UON81183.1 ATP-binding protein [Dyadobacter chenwenxiniae]